MKTVYKFHPDSGLYLGPLDLDDGDLSPEEDGVYLIPGGAVDVAPPALQPGEYVRWNGVMWSVIAAPPPPVVVVPEPPPPPTVLQQIVALEVANPITHRTLREVILAMGLVVQQVTGKPAAANPYYVKLAALNAQIDTLAESIRSAP